MGPPIVKVKGQLQLFSYRMFGGLSSQAFLPRQLQQITCMPSQGQWLDLQWGPLPRQMHQQGQTLNPPGPGAYSPQGPASGEKDPTNEEPNQAQTDGIPYPFGSSCRFGSKSSIRLTNVFPGWLG